MAVKGVSQKKTPTINEAGVPECRQIKGTLKITPPKGWSAGKLEDSFGPFNPFLVSGVACPVPYERHSNRLPVLNALLSCSRS